MKKLNHYEFAQLGVGSLCYIKAEKVSDLADLIVAANLGLAPDADIWSIFNANGERLAALTDRDAAFNAAAYHNFVALPIQ